MLRLRPFVPGDDAELISWVPDAETLWMFAGATLTWPLDHLQLEAIRADERLVALTGWTRGPHERRAAHGELVPIDDDGILIARLIVAPALRGHGLGGELVRALLAESAGRGAGRVELNVYPDNDVALGLYRAEGFRYEGRVAPSDGALRMSRALGWERYR